ncbi:MAG: DUF4097 family beta strand repeat-containing protein [Chloroflexota bacterium]
MSRRAFPWIAIAIGIAVAIYIATNTTGDYTVEPFNAPLEDAVESAEITIDISSRDLIIDPLDRDAGDIINGTADIVGSLEFNVSDESDRTIQLSEDTLNRSYRGTDPLEWEARITPEIPVLLNIVSSSGEIDADLTGLQLTGLNVNSSSGDPTITLPTLADGLDVAMQTSSGNADLRLPDSFTGTLQLQTSSGELDITIGEQVSVTIDLSTSSGDSHITIPDEVGIRLDVRANSAGEITVPDRLRPVSVEDGEGVWETADFETAEYTVMLTVSVSSGDVTIR